MLPHLRRSSCGVVLAMLMHNKTFVCLDDLRQLSRALYVLITVER